MNLSKSRKYALMPLKITVKLLLLAMRPAVRVRRTHLLQKQVLSWTERSAENYYAWKSSVVFKARIDDNALCVDMHIRATNHCIPLECDVRALYAVPASWEPKYAMLNKFESMEVLGAQIDGKKVSLYTQSNRVQRAFGNFCQRHFEQFFVLYQNFAFSGEPGTLQSSFLLKFSDDDPRRCQASLSALQVFALEISENFNRNPRFRSPVTAVFGIRK